MIWGRGYRMAESFIGMFMLLFCPNNLEICPRNSEFGTRLRILSRAPGPADEGIGDGLKFQLQRSIQAVYQRERPAVRISNDLAIGHETDDEVSWELLLDPVSLILVLDLIADNGERPNADFFGQSHDGPCRGDAPGSGLDDDNHHIDGFGRRPSQVLDSRLHIDDHGFIPVEEDLGKKVLQEDIFGAGTALAALPHGTHDQEFDAPIFEGKSLGDIIDARVHLEELAELLGIGSRSFLDQLALGGYGDETGNLLSGDSERRSQVGVGVGIDGQDSKSRLGQIMSEKAGHR